MERYNLEDLSIDGRMILKWILSAAQVLKPVLMSCCVRQGIAAGIFTSGFPPKPFMKFLFSIHFSV
jgi:hypothetical protein